MLETAVKLVMSFEKADGEKVNLTINDPREDISEQDIKSAMELIVEKNIFAPGDFDIVAPINAKIVHTETTEYELV